MQFWPCSNPLCPWRHKITTSSPICVTSFMNVPQSVVFFLINFVKMCTPVFLVVWRHLWMSPWFFCNFSNVFCYCFFQVKMLIPWSSKKWCTNWLESWVIWEKTLQTLGNFPCQKQWSNLTLQWLLRKDLTDNGQFLNCLEPSFSNWHLGCDFTANMSDTGSSNLSLNQINSETIKFSYLYIALNQFKYWGIFWPFWSSGKSLL